MPVTMQQVRQALDPDEPDYGEAAKLGPGAFPHLNRLLSQKDPGLASKAASLAGMIGGDRSVAVLQKAASHADARVRVAAAHSAQYLAPDGASVVLAGLVADADVGVQKVALRSVPRGRVSPDLRKSVERVSKGRNPAIKQLATDVLSRIG